MYVHKSVINLPTNASAIDRNLALCYSRDAEVLADTLAVVHETYVNMVPITSSTRRSKYVPIFKGEDRAKGVVKQIKWVQIEQQIFFVVLSNNGLQLYNNDISNVVYYHGCRETGDENSYTIGVCVLKNNILCVGTHLGTVWMFKPNENLTDFKVINRVYAHDEAVTLIEGLGSFMISSSDVMTYMWSFNDQDFDILRKLEVPGMLSTSANVIKFKFGLIIVGYKSGEFCIFDMNDEEFYIRTLAHMLKITGLDFSATFHVVTVSEDSYIKLWKYEQVNNKVTLAQTIQSEDGPLYGVGFLNYNSTEFCTVTGNSAKVNLYIDWESEVEIEVTDD